MSDLLEAASVGDLAKVQQLVREGGSINEADSIGTNALMHAVIHGHAPIVNWALRDGGALISDANRDGRTALSIAIDFGRYGLVEWLLEKSGAKISDTAVIDGEHESVWDHFNLANFDQSEAELQSLLKVMVLLGDAPPDFIARLEQQNSDIAIQGRHIRALRPSYLEQQHVLTTATSLLPTVFQSIVIAYAEPTPEDMWTDWVQWM
jgi:ankyrin repeat protein